MPKYLSIKAVDNGFVVEQDAYSSERKSKTHVARTVQELHELLKILYPIPEEPAPAS